MKKLMHLIPFYVSIIIYLVSLTMTYFYTGTSDISGIMMLVLVGWLSGINDIFTFLAWFANISYFVSISSYFKHRKEPKRRRGLIISIVTLSLSVFGFFMGALNTDTVSQTMQSGSFGGGFYLWILSFILMTTSMYLRLKKKKAEQE